MRFRVSLFISNFNGSLTIPKIVAHIGGGNDRVKQGLRSTSTDSLVWHTLPPKAPHSDSIRRIHNQVRPSIFVFFLSPNNEAITQMVNG